MAFFKKSGFNSNWVVGLFLIKIAAGAIYGWFFTRFANFEVLSDTWRYYFGGIQEKAWLLNDPLAFLTDLVKPRYEQDGGILSTQNSLLNDVKDLAMYKLVAIFNLLSGDRYYVNVVFYNFITLFGIVALAKFWSVHCSSLKINWWLVLVGLLPASLFWCSGIHKDGLLLCAAAFGWACLRHFLEKKEVSPKRLLLFVGCVGVMFLLRNVFCLVFLMSAVCWWLATIKKHAAAYILVFVVCSGLVFFSAKLIYPKADLPLAFAQRQAEFLKIPGESQLPTPLLHPSAAGFLHNLPSALNHGFLRPYLWEMNKAGIALSAIEQLCFAALFVWALVVVLKNKIFLSHGLLLLPGF